MLHEATVEVKGFNKPAKAVTFVGRKLPAIMLRVGQASTGLMVTRVVTTRLTGGNFPNLNRRTGTLIRNVTASRKHEMNDDLVKAWIGTNLVYGIAHEEGFDGTVQVRQHPRRITERVRTKAAKARARKKRRSGATLYTTVRAHQRKMMIFPRHYLRHTLLQTRSDIPVMARRALLIAARHGRLPRIAEIAGGMR